MTDTEPLFAIRNLSVLSYAQGFTQWHYKGGAYTLAAVQRSGFFDAAADMLAPGDMMLVSAADGGCHLFIDSVTGGRVKVRVMATTGRML